MNKLTIFLLLLLSQLSFTQEKRVLFLGNSYTYGNNLPDLFATLSADGSHSVFVDSYTAGGQILDTYANATAPQNKIKEGNWDIVILQEQSQIPTIPYYKENLMYPAARQLEDTIRKYNPCATIMMFMTWGRRFGGQQCDSDGTHCSPVFADFSHMQDSLASAYTGIANEIQASVAPVGRAWEDIILNTSTVLHTGDNSHPNNNGSYLAACVFYAMIWKESPVGLATQIAVDASLAPILQESARKIVFESDFDWNINIDSPQAQFSYELLGQNVNFLNESISPNTTTYAWDFGDGNTSDEENPSHTYTNTGNYMVRLTITQINCSKEDIFTQEISILSTSLESRLKNDDFLIYPNPSIKKVEIKSPLFLEKLYEITLINNKGKVVKKQISKLQETQKLQFDEFKQGQYFIRIQSQENPKEYISLKWIKID